jgi:hypothetical protein
VQPPLYSSDFFAHPLPVTLTGHFTHPPPGEDLATQPRAETTSVPVDAPFPCLEPPDMGPFPARDTQAHRAIIGYTFQRLRPWLQSSAGM